MRLHLQRVTRARITIQGANIASIDAGLLALIGFGKADTQQIVEQMLKKLLAYRLLADNQGKTNLSLAQAKGALLLVPQFTLYASTSRGLRPSYSNCAETSMARELFSHSLIHAKALCRTQGIYLQHGRFGEDMQVELVNDGPFTILLDSDG